MDGYDPNYYEEKKQREHIQRVQFMADGDYGFMPWCPCGDALTKQLIEGMLYITCDKYKALTQYESWLHYRKRWDKAVTEKITRLKEKNESQEKKIRELGFELEQGIRRLQMELYAMTEEIKELYDVIKQVACGCEPCKDNVDRCLGLRS